MFKKFKIKIEKHRNSQNFFWKSIFYLKDIMWALYIIFIFDVKVVNEKKAKTKLSKLKILYLYDTKGWSYHNVGKLWFEDRNDVEIDFRELSNFNKQEIVKYDQVWYNTPATYFSLPFSMDKSFFVVHGLNEISNKSFKWRLGDFLSLFLNPLHFGVIKQNLKLLKKAKFVIAISEEIKNVLAKKGICAHLISTTSLLPRRDDEIVTKKSDVVSVFALNKIKNPIILKRLSNYARSRGLKFTLCIKRDNYIQPKEEYIKLLDHSEVYVCASFSEGGPLPAMDAMTRGCVVLTTPVGQMLEIVKDGQNGFFCRSEADFKEKIDLLSSDLSLLNEMRINSLKMIFTLRNKDIIAKQVTDLLKVAS